MKIPFKTKSLIFITNSTSILINRLHSPPHNYSLHQEPSMVHTFEIENREIIEANNPGDLQESGALQVYMWVLIVVKEMFVADYYCKRIIRIIVLKKKTNHRNYTID
jgi:hypothetical protein